MASIEAEKLECSVAFDCNVCNATVKREEQDGIDYIFGTKKVKCPGCQKEYKVYFNFDVEIEDND